MLHGARLNVKSGSLPAVRSPYPQFEITQFSAPQRGFASITLVGASVGITRSNLAPAADRRITNPSVRSFPT